MSPAARQDDWRRLGQEIFLKKARFSYRRYTPHRKGWEHDHCEFCGVRFSLLVDDDVHEGYCTEDGYRWVCETCFQDFGDEFEWTVI